jgi:hypothetical protein
VCSTAALSTGSAATYSLDVGVEAGNVSRVRLGCFQVTVGEDLVV